VISIVSDSLLEFVFAADQRAFSASEVASAIPHQQLDFYECDLLFLLP